MAEHPGVLYFYSESVGLGANAACAFVAALANLGVVPRDLTTGALFLVIGGVIQLFCAFRSFRAYDHFGATVFGFYAAFWALFGLEIILSSSINLLHIALLVVSVLLTAVAPLVNGFYTAAVGSISVALSLELALRVVEDASKWQIVAAVSELIVVLVTSYGTVAAILHGIHERQVLPGFDDAVVETVLLKRNALKSKYSDGTWANPAPLGSICCALGFIGMASSSHGSWDGDSWGLVLWLATFAAILTLVSLFHGLRHEKISAVSSICDASLLAISATANEYDTAAGLVFVSFAVVRLVLMGFALAERFALMHVATFLLQVLSLLAMSIGSFLYGTNPEATVASSALYVTSAAASYSAVAELSNSVAQKELLPTGCALTSRLWGKVKSRWERSWREEEPSLQSLKKELGSTGHTIPSDEETGGAPRGRETFLRSRRASLETDHFNTSDDNDQDNASDSDLKYPGDHNLIGHSDFQSPLFVMTAGIALYSSFMAIGAFSGSKHSIFDGALVLLVGQIPTLLICGLRGQTTFGFLAFTYVIEGTLLCATYFSGEGASQIVTVLVLQLVWLLASFHVFRLLSASTTLYLAGLFFYTISEFVSSDAAGLQYVAGVIFILTSVVSLVTLGLLLGSDKSLIARRIIESTAQESEDLCETGFASDRDQFDECVRILREGGVACIPTDTVYCLACAADRPDAIKRIYDIKNRPSEKPLSLWLGSIEDIKKVSPEGKGWTPKLFSFMDDIWPGSVSLVVSRGSWLQRMGVGSAADLIGTPDSIALRVPNSTLTVALLKETGPLAITSANPSGACDCTHHNKVDNLIASKIDYILADGPSPMTIASSVVDVRNVDDNELFFFRVGCVPESYIWNKLNNTKNQLPLLTDIRGVKTRTIESFMAQIIKLAGCASYKIYMAVTDQEECSDGEDMLKMSWEELPDRIENAFISGTTYYGIGNAKMEGEEEGDESEMIVPVRNTHGRVLAVLQLLNKASNGAVISFTKSDLDYCILTQGLLCDNIVTDPSLEWQSSSKVVVLSERGYNRRTDLFGKHASTGKARPRLSRHVSMGSMKDCTSRSMSMRSNSGGFGTRFSRRS